MNAEQKSLITEIILTAGMFMLIAAFLATCAGCRMVETHNHIYQIGGTIEVTQSPSQSAPKTIDVSPDISGSLTPN